MAKYTITIEDTKDEKGDEGVQIHIEGEGGDDTMAELFARAAMRGMNELTVSDQGYEIRDVEVHSALPRLTGKASS